jgi:hypothetical protein
VLFAGFVLKQRQAEEFGCQGAKPHIAQFNQENMFDAKL